MFHGWVDTRTEVTPALGQLAAAIDALVAEPAGDADAFLELERLADRLEAERSRRARAVHRNGGWARDGAVSMEIGRAHV